MLKAWYKRRWCIEELFRELKQCLHLERCQCRSFAQQVQHAYHAIKAWHYLRDAYPDKSLYVAKREVLYLVRYDKSFPENFLNRVA